MPDSLQKVFQPSINFYTPYEVDLSESAEAKILLIAPFGLRFPGAPSLGEVLRVLIYFVRQHPEPLGN